MAHGLPDNGRTVTRLARWDMQAAQGCQNPGQSAATEFPDLAVQLPGRVLWHVSIMDSDNNGHLASSDLLNLALLKQLIY